MNYFFNLVTTLGGFSQRRYKNVVCFTLVITLAACQATTVTDLSKGEVGTLVYRSSLEDINLRGDLEFPANVQSPFPAMIVVHGSGGVGSREHDWASFFRSHGIATLIIDYFGPRNVNVRGRHLPAPSFDLADALKLLSTHPKIDPTRIGVIGFSRGGGMAVISANHDPGITGKSRYAAHVGLYPSCVDMTLVRGGSGAPVLILIGDRDTATSVRTCSSLVQEGEKNGRTARLIVYQGAAHGWDGSSNTIWVHPVTGLEVPIEANSGFKRQSRADVLEFISGPLRLRR